MPEAAFTIVYAGPLVTFQDSGRGGLMRFGVPRSGPMDRASFEVAQAAIGNSLDAMAIEVSLGGVSIECTSGQATFAITGGEFEISIDGTTIDAWCVAEICAGQVLTVHAGSAGSWAYLVFAGRPAVQQWLGSGATHEMSGLGAGRLMTGDQLLVTDCEQRENRFGEIPRPPSRNVSNEFNVVWGPQDRFFEPQVRQRLVEQTYFLTDAYNRMGVRLRGPSLRPNVNLDMPSQAVLRGSIQVAGDGVATVLLSDHQTTGGYPKIATVVSADVDDLTQLRAGAEVRFNAVTPKEALDITRSRHARHLEHLSVVAQARGTLVQRLATENLISGVVSEQTF